MSLVVATVSAGSYTPPGIDSINVTFPTGYTAPDIDSINVTFGYASANDTCSPSGTQNHVIDCSDYCNITSPLDMGGYNLTFNGTGEIVIDAAISNFNIFDNEGDGCIIYVNADLVSA